MATPSTSTPDMSLTSLSVTTGGGGTTTTNLETVGMGAPGTTASLPIASGVTVNSPHVMLPTEVAELTLSDTTLTAYALPSTTGLAVLNGQTLTFRGEGITLSDGNVVSLGFDGLVESTATATYSALDVSGLLTSSYPIPTGPGPVLFNSTFPLLASTTTSGLTGSQSSAPVSLATSQSQSQSGSATSSTDATTVPGGTGGSFGGSETSASASPSGTGNAAPSLSAGRAAMLLGAIGGVAAFGL